MRAHNVSPARPYRRAYTIIELLVVISIMAIVLATSLEIVRAVLTANALDGASNQVSAALASARAVALRDGVDTACFFYLGPNNQILYRITKYTGTVDPTYGMLFTDFDDRPAESLPVQIMLRGPQFSGLTAVSNWIGPAPAPNSTTVPTPGNPVVPAGTPPAANITGLWLAVWFGPDGAARTNSPTGVLNIAYQPTGNSSLTTTGAQPIPVVLLYNVSDMMAAGYADNNVSMPPSPAPQIPMGNQNVTGWLADPNTPTSEIRMLSFNRYTGVLVRKWN